MDDHHALQRARDLLAKPASWTQGAAFRNKHGLPVAVYGRPAACKFAVSRSLRGALHVAEAGPNAIGLVLYVIHDYSTLREWNDAPGRTHAEVLDVLDRAIRLAKPVAAGIALAAAGNGFIGKCIRVVA